MGETPAVAIPEVLLSDYAGDVSVGRVAAPSISVRSGVPQAQHSARQGPIQLRSRPRLLLICFSEAHAELTRSGSAHL